MSELALQAPRVTQQRATLLDLLDRILGKGVVAYGDIVLSIADLDLVYLNLRAVLSSIGTLESKNGGSNHQPPTTNHQPPPFSNGAPACDERSEAGRPEPAEEDERRQTRKFLEGVETLRDAASQLLPPDPTPTDRPLPGGTSASPESSKRVHPKFVRPLVCHPHENEDQTPSSIQSRIPAFAGMTTDESGMHPGKLKLDPKDAAQGLAKLAMTLINLLRKLMERQAIRRMEAGTVTPEQLERAGQAFQRLDDQIKELCKQFGLKEEDLNLDLGPLGKVV